MSAVIVPINADAKESIALDSVEALVVISGTSESWARKLC